MNYIWFNWVYSWMKRSGSNSEYSNIVESFYAQSLWLSWTQLDTSILISECGQHTLILFDLIHSIYLIINPFLRWLSPYSMLQPFSVTSWTEFSSLIVHKMCDRFARAVMGKRQHYQAICHTAIKPKMENK